MVVCAIMLITVCITLCVFIYCYKQGHILNKNQPEFISHFPYGNMDNRSLFVDDELVEVQDKLTNTIATISPLRPRDIRKGVWQGQNAFGGQLTRPSHPPVMVHRVIEALPNEIDRQQGISNANPNQTTIIHIPNVRRQETPEYEIVEEIIEIPQPIKVKPRFNNVSVRRVRNFDENSSINGY